MADDVYTIRELGPGVFIRQGLDNCVWADLGDGTLVIDTLEEPELAEVIKQAVAETVGKPIRYVVNTHWDGDHTAGNPVFAAEGASVLAHESCALVTPNRDGQPDEVFHDHAVVQGQGREARVEWLGGTHTPADSIVHLPWARVLHIADLFGWGLFMQRGDTPEKSARSREVLGRILTYDVDTIVCGHGPTLTPKEVRRYLKYFNHLWETVPALRAQGKDDAAIQAALPVPDELADWFGLAKWKHARNIERILESLNDPASE